MNDADNLKNHRGSLCPGPDPHCGGAYVSVLRGGGGVHCGLCGPVPAGDPLPAGRADIIDGKLVMGMAQDVYLAEFDGVQQRTFFIEIIGE